MQKYTGNGLVFWSEKEIRCRDNWRVTLLEMVSRLLRGINPSIQVMQVETPALMPADWAKGHLPFYRIDERYALRGESTAGTYLVQKRLLNKLPVCLYQVNKSFRDEEKNSIRLSNYRLREFWQMEFQVFYSDTTKADYHSMFITAVANEQNWRVVELEPDDLPPYSERTTDLEMFDGENWVEVASISTRKDFDFPVFEISFGLDRLMMITQKNSEG